MNEFVIRRIETKDFRDIYELNKRLGYEYEVNRVRANIQNLLDASTDIILVAEKHGKVIGYIHACPYNTLYSDRFVSIVQFVFDSENHRDQFYTDALIKAFEELAVKNGYHGIRMAVDTTRTVFSEVLLRNGYESKRDLKHYRKLLDAKC